MEKYISKAAIVAEIEKKLQDLITCKENTSFTEQRVVLWAKIDMCNEIFSILDTLEVKEVDLEKEIENIIEKEKAFVTDNREVKYYNGDSFNHIYELEFIAKYFFELGLKTQKGE